MAKQISISESQKKKDSDYVFYELTRSICPECRKVIDAHILLRDNKVYMRKRCPDCGPFEGLVYGDAEMYVAQSKYNKPGTIPLAFGTDIPGWMPLRLWSVSGPPAACVSRNHRSQQRVQHELPRSASQTPAQASASLWKRLRAYWTISSVQRVTRKSFSSQAVSQRFIHKLSSSLSRLKPMVFPSS